MNRNTEQHFANVPSMSISRSKWTRPFDVKLTANSSELFPIFIDCTVQPGDTITMRMSEVVRQMTPIAPVMDNLNLDTYFFFVPYRLIWEHWKQFYGETDTQPWVQQTEYTIPQIKAPTGGWKKGDLADYFGYPTEVAGYEATALPFRAYALIWNEWFRDENLKNPCYISMGDSTITGASKTTLGASWDYVTDIEKGAGLCYVAKNHDYFTSALPTAQRAAQPVYVPLGQAAPVIGGTMKNSSGTDITSTGAIDKQLGLLRDGSGNTLAYYDAAGDGKYTDLPGTSKGVSMWADLSNAVGATITQLRQAFAIQKYYERAARGGVRYIESIKSHFGVTNPDYRMQRPEYMGGRRIPITINQVIQSNPYSEYATEESGSTVYKPTTPLGTAGAYSVTSDKDDSMFTRSFTEHGILMGLACIRVDTHTYQQGLNRQFSMKKLFDFYSPEFANLSEQAILNKEIMCQGPSVVDSGGNVIDEQAFGYQECWAHYRYMPNQVVGEMRSNYAQSLDVWHYADYYSTLPSLSSEWIDEDKANVARTLAVQSHDQFFGDFYFAPTYTRPMPMYSVPGLIDHH